MYSKLIHLSLFKLFLFLLIQKPKILVRGVVSARKIIGYYHDSYVNDVYMP